MDTIPPPDPGSSTQGQGAVSKQLRQELNRNLADYGAISAFRLIPTPFSQEAGEVSRTLKLRRKAILEHYHREAKASKRGVRLG